MKQEVRYAHLINTLVVVGDLIILNLVFVIMFELFKSYLDWDVIGNFRRLLFAFNLSYIPTINFFSIKLAERIVYAEKIVSNVFWFICFHAMIFIVLIMMMKLENVSRLYFVGLYSVLFIVLICWRLCIRFALKNYRKRGFNFKNIIIIGAGKNGISLYNEMKSDVGYGYRIMGFFEDNPVNIPSDSVCLGPVDKAKEYITNNPIDEVYCTLPESAERKIVDLMNFCESNMIHFMLVPTLRRYVKKQMKLDSIGDIPVFLMREEPLQYPFNKFVKRTFDILFSTVFLCTLFPILYIIIGIIIKADSPGPVLFKQKRTGLKGSDFVCYKFRTMRVNKDADVKQATKNDARTTKIGAFLRKTNLDELPQFVNVLIGNMSVVGPRPHMLKHTIEYSAMIDKYMLRHLAKPGITGWAQVNGRNNISWTKKFELDVWYVDHCSFALDVKIILMTIKKVLFREDISKEGEATTVPFDGTN